jgi:hypothetical protein
MNGLHRRSVWSPADACGALVLVDSVACMASLHFCESVSELVDL